MTTPKENKITYGLCNVHYAKITGIAENGKFTYATPIAISGAVELSLDARGDLIEFFADNMVYYSADNNQGYEGNLTIANVPDSFSKDILGEVEDETDKVMHEVSNAKPSDFALLFQFEGDVKEIRHVLYNCSVSRPTVASSTKSNSVEPNTVEMAIVSKPRPEDNKVKTKTTTATPSNIYDNWFTKVYEKGAVA